MSFRVFGRLILQFMLSEIVEATAHLILGLYCDLHFIISLRKGELLFRKMTLRGAYILQSGK